MSSVIACGLELAGRPERRRAAGGDDGLEAVLVRHVQQEAGEVDVVLDDQQDAVAGLDVVGVVVERRCRRRRLRPLAASAQRRAPGSTSIGCAIAGVAPPAVGAAPAAVAGGCRALAGLATYVCGRYSVNVLPSPGVLRQPDLAAEQPRDLAADRQAQAVPPYLRLVEPSACWNASKMICCFSGGMPMPVSLHAERDHRLAPG